MTKKQHYLILSIIFPFILVSGISLACLAFTFVFGENFFPFKMPQGDLLMAFVYSFSFSMGIAIIADIYNHMKRKNVSK